MWTGLSLFATILAACSGPHSTQDPGTQRVQAALTPALSTQSAPLTGASINNPIAYAATFPYADCRVHPTGQASPTTQLPADDLGVIRFYEPPAETWGVDLTLDCVGRNGATESIQVNLQASATYQIPPVEAVKPAPKLRRAFPGNIETAKANDFIALGFPPPPPKTSGAYKVWKTIVTTDAMVPHDEPTGIFDSFNNVPEGSYNYGGEELHQANIVYNEVFTYLTVPSVTNNGILTNTSMWAGLGGDVTQGENNYLIQAGVELDSTGTSASYYAWTEAYPSAAVKLMPPAAFPVFPGDEIFVECWPSDSSGNMTVTGKYASFWLSNQTHNWGFPRYGYNPGSVPPYQGQTVAFIMEAKLGTPNNGGFTEGLTEYSGTNQWGGAFDTNNSTYHDFGTDTVIDYQLNSSIGQYSLERASTGFGPDGNNDQTNFTWLNSK
jgi:hypothetical protein